MIETKGYRELIVWQTAMHMIPQIYQATDNFPKTERFGLSDQMRRAAVSIAANIAEGHGRGSPGEYRYFLGVSRGSLAELDTLLEVAVDLQYLPGAARDNLQFQLIDIRKLLFGLHRKVKESIKQTKR